jgi:AraC-like DNA-binding protein
VHRFIYPLDGGNVCTVIEPHGDTLDEQQAAFDRQPRFPVDQVWTPVRAARRHDRLCRLLASSRETSLAAEELALDIGEDILAVAHGTRVRSTPGYGLQRRRRIAEDVRALLNAHLARPPSLATLARLTQSSPWYVSRAFREHVGVPMRSYLARLRVLEATRRLRSGATDLARLAIDLGYSDQPHFTRAFRAAWGFTPSQFRREWRGTAHER